MIDEQHYYKADHIHHIHCLDHPECLAIAGMLHGD
jgi:hypothetical protein